METRHSSNGYNHNPRNMHHTNNPSTATLRLLCHVMAAGGVIGHKGSVVRKMESQIGVRISLSGAIPGCVERVVTVTGSDVVCRKVGLGRGSVRRGKEDVEAEVFDVSPVQEAVLRVFERMLEVDAENYGNGEAAAGGGSGFDESLSCCFRLLADRTECGILIGKGGKRVAQICRECRANIRVLRPEQNPACVSPDDSIIHITGGLLSVKRGLLAVSNVLQGLGQSEKGSALMNVPTMMSVPIMMNVPVVTVPRQALPDPHAEFFPDLCVPVRAARGIAAKEVNTVNISHSVHQGDEQCIVIFKMIFSNNEAGAVIGKGATVVRLLQNESGAFIQFAPSVDGVEHRIVTISAKEGISSSYSPAQNAVVRIVARLAAVASKESRGGSEVKDITVRFVISSAQADSFRVEESVPSEIRDVEIHILEGDHGDKILQVTGEYRALQNALLQVTKKLRNSCFPSSLLKEAEAICHHSCAIPDNYTYGRMRNFNLPPVQKSLQQFPNFNQQSLMRGMNDLQISNQSNGHLPRQKEMGEGNMSRGDCDPKSTKIGDIKLSMTVEVPDHAFDSVFGENGSNIDRIKHLSAADIQVPNPAPGQTQCKVIVSGEPAQVLAASSLLKAYIKSAS
ncbi:unnamed protein product [Rhodiola kirilowii]